MASKAAELRELPDEELTARIESAKEELFNLRFQLATGQLDNPMRIKDVRHEIAQILTIVRERDLEAERVGRLQLAAEHVEVRVQSPRVFDAQRSQQRDGEYDGQAWLRHARTIAKGP